MVTDEDVNRADDTAEDAKNNAKQVRQEAIDEHRQTANSEEIRADRLE